MEAMVQEVTGVKMLTLHHDISTSTGEEVVLSLLRHDLVLSSRIRFDLFLLVALLLQKLLLQ